MKTLTTVAFLLLFGLVDLTAQKQINKILTQNFEGASYEKQDSIQYVWSNLETDQSIYNWFTVTRGGGIGFYEGIIPTRFDSRNLYSWNKTMNTYSASSKTSHVFNLNGLVAVSTEMSLDSGVLKNNRQQRFQYNNAGDVTEEILSFWDDSLGWSNEIRFSRIINVTGGLDSLKTSFFNTISNEWITNTLTTYLYNNGTLSEKLFQYYSSFNQSYQPNSRTTYSENFAAGSKTERTERWLGRWDFQNEVVTYYGINDEVDSIVINSGGGSKREFYYDNDGLNEVIFSNFNSVRNAYFPHQRFMVDQFTNGDTVRVLEQSIDQSGWAAKRGDKIYTYYFNTSVGLNENLNKLQFDVYPNPSTDQITIAAENITIDQIRMVDLSGKVVFESNVKLNSSKITLPVHQLPNGTYVLSVGSNGAQTSKKIVVRH